MERFIYGYAIPFGVAFLLAAVGMYFVLESLPTLFGVVRGAPITQQPEIAANQQVFKDVLQTALAIAALSIAAFGYGTYKILSSQIEERVRKNTDMQYRLTMAYHRASFAFVFWRLYESAERQSPTAKVYLDVAIDYTRRAYDEHVADMNQDDSKVEQLICEIRNNLAYYISAKHADFGPVGMEERGECLIYLDWLESRIGNYPQRAHAYRDTIATVKKRLSVSDNASDIAD